MPHDNDDLRDFWRDYNRKAAESSKDNRILTRNRQAVTVWKGFQEEKTFQTCVMSAARMNTA